MYIGEKFTTILIIKLIELSLKIEIEFVEPNFGAKILLIMISEF